MAAWRNKNGKSSYPWKEKETSSGYVTLKPRSDHCTKVFLQFRKILEPFDHKYIHDVKNMWQGLYSFIDVYIDKPHVSLPVIKWYQDVLKLACPSLDL